MTITEGGADRWRVVVDQRLSLGPTGHDRRLMSWPGATLSEISKRKFSKKMCGNCNRFGLGGVLGGDKDNKHAWPQLWRPTWDVAGMCDAPFQ